jgi:glycosyltransferase involved in cell wall biosynthesis
MRIGIYAPNMTTPAPSGVERYVCELVRALQGAQSGHEFILFSDSAAPSQWRHVAVPPMGRLSRLRFDHGRLARMVGKERLDVLHCTKSFVPAGLKCAGVMTVYDVIFLRDPGAYSFWWKWYWTRALERSVERAARIVTISETTLRDLESFLPASRGKAHAIPIGVDPRAFSLSGRAKRRFFLCVGTITVRKNIPVLLDAFASIRERTKTELVVVGTPEYGARDVMERLGEPGVRYLARVDDEELSALYQDAMALVYPSRYEGFGLPLLEAMAAGCPVITTTGGALPEVVGDAGLLVEPGSVAALAGAMECVADDPDLRSKLARMGLARAREFTWERTAARTIEVYEEAARGGAHETAARP